MLLLLRLVLFTRRRVFAQRACVNIAIYGGVAERGTPPRENITGELAPASHPVIASVLPLLREEERERQREARGLQRMSEHVPPGGGGGVEVSMNCRYSAAAAVAPQICK